MKKKSILVAALAFSSLSQAQPATPLPGHGMPYQANATARFEADSPAGLLEEGMGKLLRYLAEHYNDPEKLQAYVNKDVAGHFDFDYMAKSAAGSLYRYMDADQKNNMSKKIQEEFLSTMVQRLGSYNNQQVRILSQRYAPDGRTATVTAGIMGPRGYPTRLDFRFYKSKAGWKVFDVMANGQSAVVHYRRQFRQMMMPRPHGGFQPLMPRGPYMPQSYR